MRVAAWWLTYTLLGTHARRVTALGTAAGMSALESTMIVHAAPYRPWHTRHPCLWMRT